MSENGEAHCNCPEDVFSSSEMDMAVRVVIFVVVAFFFAFLNFVVHKTVAEAKELKASIRRASESRVSI